ncbi:class I SAM-dependent DNA methyltransferase [Pedobacter xixiisoli]|uniref:Methyltransferase domain-containing protein n=1 Tax=Pedobacter xixiisoli TaxID=1476464 RepID=A0A285ZPS7_9SPHI|nr:class I SAM-dependent methyltransferase [Pedobacter xixiisoli]SOD11644.1 Methyltransferase domain-containing protein [Pedobacter xixiisoli]
MNHNQHNLNTWNKVAKIYNDKFMKLDLYNETYDFICKAIKKENAKLLEIGCGPGNITKYLLQKRPDFKIYGIDLAPNMISLAEKNNPKASFSVMDARKINELESKFDGIIAGFCIPYFSSLETEKFISNAEQLLNSGGMIYISFVEGLPLQSGLMTNKNGDSVYFNYHELETLKDLLRANGFKVEHIFKVDFKRSENKIEVHTILTAKKG